MWTFIYIYVDILILTYEMTEMWNFIGYETTELQKFIAKYGITKLRKNYQPQYRNHRNKKVKIQNLLPPNWIPSSNRILVSNN